ncbi:unnamed protein product [Arabis nemorensis]|uniref:Squalene cyclase C-terminal domain-containing protein n=1 Tax=Arabis nemorensis TaxID=586526 RepID=A0A565BJG0_9BRAS|nr:unnamed protein product [Arabis nemorensis]
MARVLMFIFLCSYPHKCSGLISPVEFVEDTIVEREYLECTGSAIVVLARFIKQFPGHRAKEVKEFIKTAVKYMDDLQMPDGSWYGNWGVCFIYGTFFAVRGLVAAGKTYSNCEAVRRAVKFILNTQNDGEGGWGESYLSCPNKKYFPLDGNKTNVVNTGQALMVLIMGGQMERARPFAYSSRCKHTNQFANEKRRFSTIGTKGSLQDECAATLSKLQEHVHSLGTHVLHKGFAPCSSGDVIRIKNPLERFVVEIS